jgi:DNA-binding transcriptional MerR regulator
MARESVHDIPDVECAVRNTVHRLFRTQQVVAALGVTRRQLQYWAQTGLVVPSKRTPGGHHRYTFSDLVALKATKRLIDAGVSVQRIRKCVDALVTRLPEIQRPLEELVIVATGDVLLIFAEDSAFEAVSGQEWVFEVAQFLREIEVWENEQVQPDQSAQRVRRARSVRAPKRAEQNAS